MHTCCLLCHREFKDWGPNSSNGLPGGHATKLADAVPALSQALLREAPGRKLADAVPSLSQSLLGEVPLWICQSCCKSVEEEERRSSQEQTTPVNTKGWMWVISLCNVTFFVFLMNLSLKLWCFSSHEVAKRGALGQRSKLSCLTLYDWVLDVFKKWEETICLEENIKYDTLVNIC